MKFKPFKTSLGNVKLPPKGKSYFRFAGRESAFVREETYFTWLIDRGTHSIIDVPNSGVYEYFMEDSAMKTFQNLALHIVKNWDKHLKNYPKLKKRLLESSRRASAAAQRKDRRAALDQYLKYLDLAYDFSEYLMGAWSVVYFLEPLIAAKMPEHSEAILSLDRPLAYLKMREMLLKKPISEVQKRYGWLNVYSPHDKPYSLKQLEKIKKETALKEIKAQYASAAQNKGTFIRTLKSIKDKRLKRIAEVVHTYAFLKSDRIDPWKESMHKLTPFFDYLGELTGTSVNETVRMSSFEIINLLRNSVSPSVKDLKLRGREQAIFYLEKDKISVVENSSVIQKTLKTLLKKEMQNEIKGLSASKGIARGMVKIVNSSKDLHKVRRGDIFVAKYTFVNFEPAMAKAAAIITDEGGLTSHASIVSRELNIPCIVGTKSATHFFRDGDFVEVDADKGIVRRL